MLTRIELTNFMAHRHTVLEPAAGLTVLIGPNNVGKSAVVAALQILCRNENSTYVKRHGTKECSVKVWTDDGHEVEWRRRNSPSYVIDGQTFDRLRQGRIPDELHQLLRLPVAGDADDSDVDVHFGFQKSPIFLMGSSPANAAKFFASSSDSSRLVALQRRHKQKHAEAKQERTRLEEDSQRLNTQLERLEPVVAVQDHLEAVEREYQLLLELQQRVEQATGLLLVISKQTRELSQGEAVLAVLQELAPVPQPEFTEHRERVIADLSRTKAEAHLATRRLTALEPLAAPPQQEETAALEQSQTYLSRYQALVAIGEARRSALSALERPPVPAEVAPLERLVTELSSAAVQVKRDQGSSAALAELPEPSLPTDEAGLSRLILELERASRQQAQSSSALAAVGTLFEVPQPMDVLGLERLIEDLTTQTARMVESSSSRDDREAELQTLQQELREAVDGAVCPTCGVALDAERVLARAAMGLEAHAHE